MIVRLGELRRDDDVSPADQGGADAALIPGDRRRIDRPIALLDRELDHLLSGIGRRLKDPKAQFAVWPRRR